MTFSAGVTADANARRAVLHSPHVWKDDQPAAYYFLSTYLLRSCAGVKTADTTMGSPVVLGK